MTTIWTIGHSTRTQEEFSELLHINGITMLVDIRSMPGSNRYPHFNQERMREWLPESNIEYRHLPELGGRRRNKDADPAINAGWKNKSFKSYADYTLTTAYQWGLMQLNALTRETERVAYMCSEGVPWRCHRSILSNTLTAQGLEVRHIMDATHEPALHVLGAYGAKPYVSNFGMVITYPEGAAA